jgi:uncharacterized damage-inducible protein DinB
MFHTLAEFKRIWGFESAATIKILECLTDDSLPTMIDAEHRSLGRLANHLIETLTEMPKRMGLPLEEEFPAHTTTAALVADYRAKSDALIAAIDATWTDAVLSEMRDMYGEQWTVSDALQSLVMHQCHHRGQMTVLMRQAGLQVAGIYGPAKHEWVHMNMQPLP